MEIKLLDKYGVKIFAPFIFITTLLTITVCQDELVQLYNANEDNEYNEDYYSLLGHENDVSDMQFANEADVGPDTAAETSHQMMKLCDENQLMTYLAELQVTNPESLLLIASYKDLENLCRRIAGNLDSIDSFMQTCTPLPQDHLYMQLIAGLRVLNAKLCVESSYQKSYQSYLSCFHELHIEYIDCAGPADWTENTDHNELCNEYRLITNCYYTKSAMLCGIKAAEIMKDLMVKVINEIINTQCPEVRRNPVVPNAMPESVFSKATVPKFLVDNLNLILTSITKLLIAWI